MSMHWFELLPCGITALVILPAILVGFLWIRPDADTRGQPGLLWALLTIPLSWIAVLTYAVVRALTPPTTAR